MNAQGIQPTLLPQTKDIWARDFMPIQVNTDKFIEYRYDPDYLQERKYRKLKTYQDITCDSIGLQTIKTDIRLDGGNVVKHKNTVILTNKIIHENEDQYLKKDLIKELHELFEVEKVVLIPWDMECPFGHSDGMLRFLDEKTVLISGFYRDADEEIRKKMLGNLKKASISWEWLCFDKRRDPAYTISYINFLQTQDVILVPQIEKRTDDHAVELLGGFYHDYKEKGRIVPVNVKDITRQGGALNCVTWTVRQ